MLEKQGIQYIIDRWDIFIYVWFYYSCTI